MAPPTKGRGTAVVDEPKLETWQNMIRGRVVLNRFNETGVLKPVVINAGRRFSLTPAERRLNQSEVADESLDPFVNGMLAAVELYDDEFDTERLRANPNVISETELRTLLDGPLESFKERLGAITNPLAVRRFIPAAEEADVALSRMRLIEQRVAELEGATATEVVSAADPSGTFQAPRAVEPQ